MENPPRTLPPEIYAALTRIKKWDMAIHLKKQAKPSPPVLGRFTQGGINLTV